MTNDIVNHSNSKESPFDSIRQFDDQGNEFWSARDLMPLLGYKMWAKFKGVIDNAIENIETITGTASEHFLPVEVKNIDANGNRLQGRTGVNYKLSRLACYHVALSSDSRGNDSVKLAKHYFAVKTREAEVIKVEPVRQLPQRDAIEYIEASEKLEKINNLALQQLLRDELIDELSIKRGQKQLASAPTQYTIGKVRARELGYSTAQIDSGSGLGRFLAKKIPIAFTERVGKFDTNHYAVTDQLDAAIHDFFKKVPWTMKLAN